MIPKYLDSWYIIFWIKKCDTIQNRDRKVDKMKKAFTLIELLAVIIILAIIALIATPIVLDVINDARKSASKSAAALVLDSAKLYYAEQYIKPNGKFEGYECTISNKSGCDEL